MLPVMNVKYRHACALLLSWGKDPHIDVGNYDLSFRFFSLRVLRASLWCFGLSRGFPFCLLCLPSMIRCVFVIRFFIGRTDATELETRRDATPLACTSIGSQRLPVRQSFMTTSLSETPYSFYSFCSYLYLVWWWKDSITASHALNLYAASFSFVRHVQFVYSLRAAMFCCRAGRVRIFRFHLLFISALWWLRFACVTSFSCYAQFGFPLLCSGGAQDEEDCM